MCVVVHVWPMCVIWCMCGWCVWCGPRMADVCDVVHVWSICVMWFMWGLYIWCLIWIL